MGDDVDVIPLVKPQHVGAVMVDEPKIGTDGKSEAQYGQAAARIAILAGSGAALGALVDRGVKGAGIGAGVGGAVGLATVLLTRGKEVELRQGATLDVVFDRPVAIE